MSEENRGTVGWGDAITAAAELALTAAEDLDELVELLGLRAPAPGPEDDPLPEPGQVEQPVDVEPAGPAWATLPPGYDDLPMAQDQRTFVEALSDLPVDVFGSTAAPLAPITSLTAAVPYEPPIPATLLRAAMTMLVRRDHRSDDIDLDQVIESIAEQQPLVTLPRVVEPSTQRGVAIVADVGASMLPYLADVRAFVGEVEHVVGESNTTVEWVDHDQHGPHDAVDPEELFASGRPVLVISTLGAARAPGSSAIGRLRWLEFAEAARQHDADVLALVPHRLRSWPDDLARAIRLVAWDDLPRVGRGRD
ncbi:MAG TPA: hypothetical protein VF557_13565 [Jatrophihabitans sp.]|uniref:hypothetical protein n=1 Tax=Jatrophihabitans sp. TaxID=1932789 RepID=UPI002EF8E962